MILSAFYAITRGAGWGLSVAGFGPFSLSVCGLGFISIPVVGLENAVICRFMVNR